MSFGAFSKMANVLVAITNFPIIFTILMTIKNKDHLTTCILIFLGLSSFISHLFENHKHGMYGFGVSPKISYILNRFDVIGVWSISLRLSYLYFNKYRWQPFYVFCNIEYIFVLYC